MFTRYSHIKTLLLLALLFGITACGGPGKTTPPEPQKPIETMSVTVTLIDTQGAPIENVQISTRNGDDQSAILTATASSSERGDAAVPNVPETSDVVFVFEKDGYAAQVKTFTTPQSDALATLEVVMILKGTPQPFNADEAAELDGQDGAYLSVGANAFVDASGNPVTGEVSLQMTPVDVSTDAGLQAFPGAFSGIPVDGSPQTSIVSLGTTEFTFSQNGNELQLAEGETAVIDMPIYIATYPDGSEVEIGDEIPLWSLNETSGIWVQEGVGEVISKPASPTGLAMRAEVSHFTWWNTDWYPLEEERFEITVNVIGVDENGVPTPVFDGKEVRLHINTRGFNKAGIAIIGQSDIAQVFEGSWCFYVAGNVFLDDGSPFYVESSQVCQVLQENDTITLEVDINGVDFEVDNYLRPTATAQTAYGACGDRPRLKAKSAYPITYAIVGGSLPPGMTLEPNGAVTGAPTMWGQYQVQIEVAEDVNGERGEWDIVIWDIDVSPELEIEPPGIIPILQVGYEVELIDFFSADGGLEAYSFRESPSSALPPGMRFNSEDVSFSGTPGRLYLNGTPLMAYGADVEVEVHDQNCGTASDSYSQTTIWAPRLEGEPETAIVGENFSFTLSNTEGPIEYWENGPQLPAWASLDTTTGEITGVPSRSDVGVASEVLMRAYGPEIASLPGVRGGGAHTFTLEVGIRPPVVADINDSNQFSVAVGQNFSATPINSGGTPDIWEADNLPTWLTLDPNTGEISGTTNIIARYENILLRATNPGGSSATSPFVIDVIAQVQSPQLSGSPSVGTVGVGFIFMPTNTGGAVNQWSLTGRLPGGLSFSNGSITGSPTTAGIIKGTDITATNAGGGSVLPIIIVIGKGQQSPLSFSDSGPVEKSESDAAFANVVSGGSGTGAVTYQSADTSVATVGSSSGIVTPLSPGQTTITVTKAEDANYLAESANFTLNVNPDSVILGSPETAFLFMQYSFVPTVANGIVIASWQITGGSLPTGLILNSSSGAITGIPSEVQTENFDLRGDTSGGDAYTRSMQITVVEPPQAPNLFNNNNFGLCDNFGEVGCVIQSPGNQNIDIIVDSGTPDPVTWSISGDIPTGVTFDDTLGRFTGTPTGSGQYFSTVTAENAMGIDSIGYMFEILAEQSPLNFNDAGPIGVTLTDNTLINIAVGGDSASPIIYRSDNTTIATVNSSTGEVTFEAPGSATISATRSSDGTYLPVSAEYSLTISLPVPSIDYVYTSELPSSVGNTAYFNIKTTVIGDEYPTVVYASKESIIEPSAPETLSSTASSAGDALITGVTLNSRYNIAAQIFSGSGEQSGISNTSRAQAIVSEQILNGDANTAFGNRMAIDGDVLVVRNTLNDAYASTGDVSVYELISDVWILTQTLIGRQIWWGKALDVHHAADNSYRIAAGSDASSNFGNAQRQGGLATYTKVIADICGNDIDDDSNGQTDETGCENVPAETVYNNGIWVLEQYAEGIYPETVELNDSWMAIGKPDSNNCDTNIFTCGEVVVYRFPWSVSANQIIASPQQSTMNFHFGSSLASDDDVLIVGAPGAVGSTCIFNCGVYAYRDNGTSFDFEGSIGGNVSTSGRAFGHSVSISGNTLAIGDPTAPNEDGPTNDDGGDGVVYMYQKTEGETWDLATETNQLLSPTQAASTPALNFGVSVSLNGSSLVVGDQKQNCINEDSQCGIVHVFSQDGAGVFTQNDVFSFMGLSPEANNGFGFVVKADGSRLAVSQYTGESQNSPGDVLIYTLP